MQNIAKSTKIEFKKGDKPNQGIIIIEPCYPGYGVTLGNSLRRVLLSSLPGAAVVGLKIKGVDHEFMALPHIKEDILEIILNFKQLRLNVFSDEEVKLELNVHGEKEIKASDITKESRVEIKNPNLVLAHITDMAGNLNIEIYVSKGRGYQSVENIERENNEIGYIEMDSIFSPVLSTSVKVEDTRVGKMINWDKLILNITTDGTISPKEAFEQAVKILIDQFSSLIKEKATGGPVEQEKEVAKGKDEEKHEDKEEKTEEEIKEKKEKVEDEIKETPKKKRGRPRKSE